MKISQRITLISTVMLFIILILVNTSIYFLFGYYTMNAELARTQNQARSLVEALEPSTDNWQPREYLRASVSGEGMIRVIDESSSITVSVTARNQLLNQLDGQYTAEEMTAKLETNMGSFAVARVPMIWSDGEVVSLEMYEPLTLYEETLGILRVILIIASLFIIVPSYFAGRSLSNFILIPIQALVKTMNQIREEGTFKKIDINEKAKDELTEMGRTFNHMIDLLKENYEKQQQFVSDASHELKTPLTVIDSYAQLLKRWGKDKPEVLDEAVSAISSESKRIKEMTNQMLVLASQDEAVTMELQQVNLAKTMFETARQMETTYHRTITIQTDGHSHFLILGNEMQLKQLAFILLENGLKYSEEKLEVMILKRSENFELTVKDFGVGIAEVDIPHVFDRFYRVNKDRNRKTGGSGLGLAIAKKIVASHRGTITVESEEGKGSTFRIVFPVLTEEEVDDEK
ncbi:two-component sensor histidine kinase [Salipaludibacillus neizhouensis]|uniref:histidine kinase n=1 Tax=Salipaludibacillus neizhouensis TaxID=885475 RepID=A0A3A9JZT2_9BACI|nr:HAMP domain-containing sensor histidine kinase [Salipaludibacillus neizhouensis]RKL66384.1 two-component sensor histidine kinase [Salipaludibacillus neizhouensis]